MNDEIKDILYDIEKFLNENYDQNSKDYNVFLGAKPQVMKYKEHAAISFWSCGAIVCIYDQIFFISEDDGNWYVNNAVQVDKNTKRGDDLNIRFDPEYGYLDGGFSIGWIESFSIALMNLNEYVKEHGKPVYFSGLDVQVICHYKL